MVDDFEIKLGDKGFGPDGVSASELALLLREWEKAIEAESLAVGEEQNDSDSMPLISLVSVNVGSARYGLKLGPRAESPVANILHGLADRHSKWASVSPIAQEGVTKSIARYTNNGIPFAITPRSRKLPKLRFTQQEPPPAVDNTRFFTSFTSRSAEVVRAGGIRPAATIKLMGGDYRVQVQASRRIIKELGGLLYQKVIVKGRATIRVADMKLVGFKVDALENFPREGVEEILAEAAAASGDTWARVGGIKGFLAVMRSEEDDD